METLLMMIRDHPFMLHGGIHNRPLVWIWVGVTQNKNPTGEVGVLRTVSISDIEPRDRFLLFTEYKGSSYVSCLTFSDPGICNTIATLFRHYCNCTIAEIGSLELAYVF